MTSFNDNNPEERGPQTNPTQFTQPTGMHKAWYAAIIVALLANVGLFINGHQVSSSVAALRASTQSQFARLSDQVAQTASASALRADSVAKQAEETAASAEERSKAEVRRTSATLAARLAQQTKAQQEAQQQVAGALDELKEASNNTSSKLNEITGDVSNVKGDVTNVKSDVASTQNQVQQHGADLKRMTGDLGIMSGLIATNGKQLAALRELGERNYTEFDLKKTGGLQKIGVIQLALAKTDPKRNRFTIDVLADDKRVQKRDRTINEPVQLYVSGAKQPCEIVVNQVKKDEVMGYVSVPKVGVTRP